MFTTLFHNLAAAPRRMDIATLDDRLLADVGMMRSDAGAGRVAVGAVAASSAFPVHDVWSNHPLVRIAEPR